MIQKLGREQELQLLATRQKWIRLFEQPNYDRLKAEQSIKSLLAKLGYEKISVVSCASPLDAQHAVHFLNPRTKSKALPQKALVPLLVSYSDNRGENIRRNLWQLLGDAFGEWSRSISQHITTELRGEIKRQLWDPVDAIGQDSLMLDSRTHTEEKLKEAALPYSEVCLHLGLQDFGLLAFYDFAKHQKWCSSEMLDLLLDLALSGVFSVHTYEQICLVAPMPVFLELNEQDRISCEKGMAAYWKDGSGYFAWNGYKVSERLIMQPETFTKRDILLETNAERRRILQERLGSERFAELLGLAVIDEDTDLQGNRQYLYKTIEPDNLTGKHIYFARVTCPTTKRIYFLCVPPKLDNVWDAVAWTFGRTKDTYAPDIES